MRAELADEADAAIGRAVGDHPLAEDLHALDLAARLELARLHDRHPVAAEQLTHRGSRSGTGQQQIVVVAQHP
jgi:hypothetical protein